MAIEMVQAATQAATITQTGAKPAAGGFGESLESMLKAVETSGAEANDAVARMMSGQGDVHSALIAMQHADTTFQLTVQVRNKLVQAYQDVMRMPI